MMEIKKMTEEWEIWDDEEEAVKIEKEAKKLVSPRFHIFRKKASEKMPMRKKWDYAIDVKEGFLLRYIHC